jgi:hypothetical protein
MSHNMPHVKLSPIYVERYDNELSRAGGEDRQ